MTRRPFASSLTLLIVSLTFLAAAQEKQLTAGLQGSLTGENTYTNPALGMTIHLPEKWQMSEITTQTPVDPTCTGPLCGTPEIQVEFHTTPGSEQPYKDFSVGLQVICSVSQPKPLFPEVVGRHHAGRQPGERSGAH